MEDETRKFWKIVDNTFLIKMCYTSAQASKYFTTVSYDARPPHANRLITIVVIDI